MDRLQIDALAERIGRLERANRRWRTGAGTALIAGFVVVICGAQRANEGKSVEAEQFIVRDKDGKERARLGLASNGEPALFIRGKDGQGRVLLQSSDEDVGGLYLSGADGRLSVVLGAASRAVNTPYLSLVRDDKRSINLSVVGAGMSGQPWFSIRDENGSLFQVPEPLVKPIGLR